MCDLCNIGKGVCKLYIYSLCEKCNDIMIIGLEAIYKSNCESIIKERIRNTNKVNFSSVN